MQRTGTISRRKTFPPRSAIAFTYSDCKVVLSLGRRLHQLCERLLSTNELAARDPPLILDIPNGVPNRLETFCHFIGDVNVEFFLKLHEKLYDVE